jgi:3-oxoacyl-[acyl-carrier protein] reductase
MDLGLAGRVYVVTGASRGLGAASARTLVAEGANVVLCSRTESSLQEIVDELGGPERAVAVAGDVADPALADRLVSMATEHFGRLDGAVLSVGGPPRGTAMEVSDDDYRQAFDSIFLGVLRVTRAVVKGCGDRGGSVVLVLSTSVKQPIGHLAISNGLRPGLAITAKALADELGPVGIRVNAVLPGAIDTGRAQQIGDSLPGPANGDGSPGLGRSGTPEEFARATVFLLSPAASYVTGTMLAVDGGRTRGL